MKKIGLALGAGGARGLAHIYFLQVLDDLGIKPAMITGSSMGALIGSLYASGLSGKEIETIFADFTISKLLQTTDLSFRKGGFIEGKKIRSLLASHIRADDFSDLNIPLKVVATDIWKRSPVVLDTGNIIDAVHASITIPGIFKPVKKDNMILVDGGITNPVPFDIIESCDTVIALDVLGGPFFEKKKDMVPNMYESIYLSFLILQDSISESKRQYKNPDLYYKLPMGWLGIGEFHRIKDVKQKIKDDLDDFREKLSR